MTLLVAVLITCIIGFFFETLKMKYVFHRVKLVNSNIEKLIYEYVKDISNLDVFMVDELKHMIKDQFVATKKIDEFLLYRVDLHNMRLEYKIGYALQKIDVHMDSIRHTLDETSLEYNDDLVTPE